MPTYFTQPIVEDDECSFEKFAKSCLANFVTFEIDADAKNRYPELYDTGRKELDELHRKLPFITTMSDDDLRNEYVSTRKKEIQRIQGVIDRTHKGIKALKNMIMHVNCFTVPITDKHMRMKTFMLEQLQMTLNSECDDEFIRQQMHKIKELEQEIENVPNPVQIRSELQFKLSEQITKALGLIVMLEKQNAESNKWLDIAVNAIEEHQKILNTSDWTLRGK